MGDAYYYPCDLCGREFTTWNGLRVHQLSKVHEGKDIECDFCGRLFRTPAYLFMHIEAGVCVQFSPLSLLRSLKTWEEDIGSPRLFTLSQLERRRLAAEFYESPRYEYSITRGWSLVEQPSSSAYEQTDSYCCRQCDKNFRHLSSLFQHLESESCPEMTFNELKEVAFFLQAELYERH